MQKMKVVAQKTKELFKFQCFRDTGVLHTLLKIETYEVLFSHPAYGGSWEVTVVENIIAKYKNIVEVKEEPICIRKLSLFFMARYHNILQVTG